MQYRVIVGGILKKNGELAPFDTILDEVELDDAHARVKEGYVEEVAEKVGPKAKTKADADQAKTDKDAADALKEQQEADSAQAEKDAADKKAADEKAAADDQAASDQKAKDDAAANDLLAKAKAQAK